MALSMNMMQLFSDMSASPVCRRQVGEDTWSRSEIEAIMTPLGKGSNFISSKNNNILLIDEDSGLGPEIEMKDCDFSSASPSPRFGSEVPCLDGSFTEEPSLFRRPSKNSFKESYCRRRSLFSRKRSADTSDDEMSPSFKRVRKSESDLRKIALTNSSDGSDDLEVQDIIRAVDRLSTKQELIADGTREYKLPTIAGKHSDLRSISADTMARLLGGDFGNLLESTQIIDCRYPYEYQGGHIKGALNLYTKDEINQVLDTPPTGGRPSILIFHCEFSSERGPKMYRFLRSQDRNRNKDNYPALNYPEIYILDGGYQKFYASYKTLCDPVSYKPMLHQAHSEDLRHFRAKSKSWAGNSKKSSRSRIGNGRSISFNC